MSDKAHVIVTRDYTGRFSAWINPEEGQIREVFGREPVEQILFNEFPLLGLAKLAALQKSEAAEDEQLMRIIDALINAGRPQLPYHSKKAA